MLGKSRFKRREDDDGEEEGGGPCGVVWAGFFHVNFKFQMEFKF